MNSDIAIQVDDSQFKALIAGIQPKELRKSLRKVQRSSAKVLVKGIRSELLAKHQPKNGWQRASPERDISVKVFSLGGGYVVKLHDRRKKESGAYILRFLSTGTADRRTKKGYNRGHITASHFFRIGVEQNIGQATEEITKTLDATLQKAYQKAKNAEHK